MISPVGYPMGSTPNNATLTKHKEFHWDPLPQILNVFGFLVVGGGGEGVCKATISDFTY